MLDALTEQLHASTDLTAEHVTEAVQQMTAEAVTPEAKAEFLTALAEKGETAEELAAFAGELRARHGRPVGRPHARGHHPRCLRHRRRWPEYV